jgi:hypothetical protein
MTFPMPDGCNLCLGARVFAFAGSCWENRKQSTKELVWQVSTSESLGRPRQFAGLVGEVFEYQRLNPVLECQSVTLWIHHVHSFPDCRISVAAAGA